MGTAMLTPSANYTAPVASRSLGRLARRAAAPTAVLLALALVVLLAVAGYFVVQVLRHPTGSGNRGGAGAGASASAPQREPGAAIEAGLAAAAAYQRDGEFAKAGAILQKLAEDAPTDQRVRLAYAQALIGQGQHARALEQYAAAISVDSSAGLTIAPSSSGGPTPEKQIARNPRLAQLHAEAATCAVKAGLIPQAVDHYSMAQSMDPENPRYPLFLAMVQLKLPGEDNESAAVASLLRAAHLQPDLAEAWGTLAEIELRRNRVDLASQHLDKAIQFQPEQPKWRIVQARIFNRQGKPDQAVSVLSSLDEQTRAGKPVLQLMSESYGLLSRPADAAAMYESAARKTPTDPDLWYQAALWFQRAGDKARAAKAAQTASMLGSEPAKDLAQSLAAEEK